MEQVVTPADLPMEEREDASAGHVRSQRLLHGTPGSLDDFALTLFHTSESFGKAVQRQAFHQIRFQLKGEADFGTGGSLHAGGIAYVPGGVWYGPLAVAEDSAALLLKFGYAEAEAAVLAAGDEAAPLAVAPTLIDPALIAWVDDAAVAGVRRKFLGRFSGHQAMVQLLQVDEGVAVQLLPHSLLFVLQGAGRATGSAWDRYAAIRSDDSPGVLTATEPSELLEIVLPPTPLAPEAGAPLPEVPPESP